MEQWGDKANSSAKSDIEKLHLRNNFITIHTHMILHKKNAAWCWSCIGYSIRIDMERSRYGQYLEATNSERKLPSKMPVLQLSAHNLFY